MAMGINIWHGQIRILKLGYHWSVSLCQNLPVFQPVRPERFKKETDVLSWFTVNNALVVKRAGSLSLRRSAIHSKVSCKSVIYVSTNASRL